MRHSRTYTVCTFARTLKPDCGIVGNLSWLEFDPVIPTNGELLALLGLFQEGLQRLENMAEGIAPIARSKDDKVILLVLRHNFSSLDILQLQLHLLVC